MRRSPFRPSDPASRTKADGCLLCGSPRVVVMGEFRPSTVVRMRPVRYFLCQRCMRKPDCHQQVEAVLLPPQGGVS
jgi:hypothetical protein